MFKNNYWRNMPKYSGFLNKKVPQNEQFCSFCGSDPYGTPEWNRTTAHGVGGHCSIH